MGFGDMNNVQPSAGRLPYMGPGQYVLEINACKEVSGQKGTAFVAEFTVLESDPGNPLQPGAECSWVCGMAGGIQLQQQNIKAFLVAAAGEDPGPLTNALLGAATGAGNVLAGHKVKNFAQATKTKPKPGFPEGTDFTRMNFSPATYEPGTAPPPLATLLASAPPAPPVGRQGPAVAQPWTPPPPPAPPAPPPPPPPANPRATWQRSPDGMWALNPASNQWEPAR